MCFAALQRMPDKPTAIAFVQALNKDAMGFYRYCFAKTTLG